MVIVWLSVQVWLHFCIEESKPKSEANLKKVEIDQKEQLGEEGDYCDTLIEGHSLVVWLLLFAPIENEEKDWQ